eukprot:gene4501-4738_t
MALVLACPRPTPEPPAARRTPPAAPSRDNMSKRCPYEGEHPAPHSAHVPSGSSIDAWAVTEDHYDKDKYFQNETKFSCANGYFGLRGSFEEGTPAGASGNHGTYVNGFYDEHIIKYPEAAYGYAERESVMLNVIDAKTMALSVDGDGASRPNRTAACLPRRWNRHGRDSCRAQRGCALLRVARSAPARRPADASTNTR